MVKVSNFDGACRLVSQRLQSFDLLPGVRVAAPSAAHQEKRVARAPDSHREEQPDSRECERFPLTGREPLPLGQRMYLLDGHRPVLLANPNKEWAARLQRHRPRIALAFQRGDDQLISVRVGQNKKDGIGRHAQNYR